MHCTSCRLFYNFYINRWLWVCFYNSSIIRVCSFGITFDRFSGIISPWSVLRLFSSSVCIKQVLSFCPCNRWYKSSMAFLHNFVTLIQIFPMDNSLLGREMKLQPTTSFFIICCNWYTEQLLINRLYAKFYYKPQMHMTATFISFRVYFYVCSFKVWNTWSELVLCMIH